MSHRSLVSSLSRPATSGSSCGERGGAGGERRGIINDGVISIHDGPGTFAGLVKQGGLAVVDGAHDVLTEFLVPDHLHGPAQGAALLILDLHDGTDFVLERRLHDVPHGVVAVGLEVTGLILLQRHGHLDGDCGILHLQVLHLHEGLAEHSVVVGLQGVEGVPVQGQGVDIRSCHNKFLLKNYNRMVFLTALLALPHGPVSRSGRCWSYPSAQCGERRAFPGTSVPPLSGRHP